MNKKLAGTGLAIGLVAGAGAGLILELSGNVGAASGPSAAVVVGDSTTDTTPTSSDPTSTGDATTPVDPVRPDPSTRLADVLKPLVDDGTITQDQADKVIAALAVAGPMGGPMGGGHRGFGGPGGHFGGPNFDAISTALGITADEVRTALQSGQSIADLAVSKGKTAQDVIDAIVAEATTRINTAVTDGKLTQAEADTRLADLTTRITDLVNATPPVGGPGFGGPGFGGPGRHHDHNDADDDDAAADAPADSTATTGTVAG
ncbi:MAG: hypothetical protein ABI862_19075 [Ilumatobacteraceae bacterium]